MLSSEGRYTVIDNQDRIWYFISTYFDGVIHNSEDIQGKISYSNRDGSTYITPKNFQVKAFYKIVQQKKALKEI